jgi:AcrR family transcriptional regulator
MNQTVHLEGNKKAARRTNDPQRTMADILKVATREFADKGLAGARIDEIADATRTSKRMIYYYYGNKEGLYLAVLEDAYRRTREIEAQLHLKDLPPVQALEKLVGFTFDRHRDNEDFIRLVMNENINRGEYIRQSSIIQELNVPVIEAIQELYQRGVKEGVFRKGLNPIDIHFAISAFAFFNVSNRHTFGTIFQERASTKKASSVRKDQVIELMLRFVSSDK